MPLNRTAALGVADLFGICFPADLTQLLVDHVAGFCFRLLTLTGCLIGLLFALRDNDRRRCSCGNFCLLGQLLFGFLFLFYWFFYRKMGGGGGGGPFGFGKSKAKVLNGKEEKLKTSFADVAGIDEAKEEVQ
jgi:hypothetical protein